MNLAVISLDLSLLLAALRLVLVGVILIFFGYWFNQRVDRADREGTMEGYTWWYVIVGVSCTLVVPSLILFELALPAWGWGIILFYSFACSGWSMAWGDIQRYVEARRQHQKDLRRPNE